MRNRAKESGASVRNRAAPMCASVRNRARTAITTGLGTTRGGCGYMFHNSHTNIEWGLSWLTSFSPSGALFNFEPIMVLDLATVCKCTVLSAAAGGVLQTAYTRVRRYKDPLPFGHDSAKEEVNMWAIGAGVGQTVVTIPWMALHNHTPFGQVLLADLAATPFFVPLYVAVLVPKGSQFVARHVPALLAGTAALTGATYYLLAIPTGPTWFQLWSSTQTVCLGHCAMLTFHFINRYNWATLHVVAEWQNQGMVLPCARCMAIMHLVIGNSLAVLLLGKAMQWFDFEWWVYCVLTISAVPSIPNALSQYFQREVDIEKALWVYFGVLGAILILSLVFPSHPLAWMVINQTWLSHTQDWKNCDRLEAKERTPPAWDVCLNQSPSPTPFVGQGHVLGTGVLEEDPPVASASNSNSTVMESELTSEEAQQRERELRAKAAEERMKMLTEAQDVP